MEGGEGKRERNKKSKKDIREKKKRDAEKETGKKKDKEGDAYSIQKLFVGNKTVVKHDKKRFIFQLVSLRNSSVAK